MENKKEELLMTLKICISFFAAAVMVAYIYCIVTGRAMFRTEFIGQILWMDGFLLLGVVFGLTDIVIPVRSSKIRTAVVAIVLYGFSLYLLSFVSFNPLRDAAKFFAYTFLFSLLAVFVTVLLSVCRKNQSQKYMRCIDQFRQEHSLESGQAQEKP